MPDQQLHSPEDDSSDEGTTNPLQQIAQETCTGNDLHNKLKALGISSDLLKNPDDGGIIKNPLARFVHLEDPAEQHSKKNFEDRSEERKSRRVNHSYYSRKQAEFLMPILLKMIETNRQARFFYHNFPSMSKSALRLRIYHAWNWLIDYADKHGVFAEMRQRTIISADTAGITIKWRIARDSQNVVFSDDGSPITRQSFYIDKLVDYLENAEVNELYEVKNVVLGADDINNITRMVAEIEQVTGMKFVRKVGPEVLRLLREA